MRDWPRSKHWPSNKWWAARVSGAGTLAVLVINEGWQKPASIALTGFIVAGLVAWITPN